jgi:hypothetical protein
MNCAAIEDIARMWGFAGTLEDFEHANAELLAATGGQVRNMDTHARSTIDPAGM